MKQTICAPTSKVPTANLAVNKSRIKIYNKQGEMPTYYLQKAQEFQIELFNPTSNVVLAKITLNGNTISQGGLVLKPGERVFLERYLDVAKKFLFDTYEVANTKEVKAAIENNGDFKVEFFRERQPVYYNQFILTNGSSTTLNGGRTIFGGPNHGSGILHGSSDYNSTFTTYSSGLNNSTSIPIVNAFFKNTNEVTMDSFNATSVNLSQSNAPLKKELKSRSTKSIETGRVEKGSYSDQKMKTINKDFEYWAFHTVEYKMLPISQKVNTAGDINVKVYCTNCGSKLSKGHKFCSSCGTKA